MKSKPGRELRLYVCEFLLSCAVDVAPRDSRLRFELARWFKNYLEAEWDSMRKPLDYRDVRPLEVGAPEPDPPMKRAE